MELKRQDLVKIKDGIDKNSKEEWEQLFITVNILLTKYFKRRVSDLDDREDLRQEINLKLFKKIQTDYFNKTGRENFQPENFKKWLYTVARNTLIDYQKPCNTKRNEQNWISETKKAKKDVQIESIQKMESDLIEGKSVGTVKLFNQCSSREDNVFVKEEVEIFYGILNEVVFSNCATYKVMSWMIYVLYFIEQENKVTERVVNDCKLMSLNELLNHIEKNIDTYNTNNSLQLSAQRQSFLNNDWYNHMKKRLNTEFYEGAPVGEHSYETFFMKKGGKATISDWVNRINANLKRKSL